MIFEFVATLAHGPSEPTQVSERKGKQPKWIRFHVLQRWTSCKRQGPARPSISQCLVR